MKKKTPVLHLAIIIIGILFLSVSAFHTNIWLDESYSVAIANHTYAEIWSIGGHDVHPVLYYWILHTLSLIFGNNILVYRLFSVLIMSILGIIGYTHIRKDFGEKTGMLFSFFVFFLPINLIYATEIRMYTCAMLFVTVMAIYAYRIWKNSSNKNWILFAIFSLASAYTHYYGLVAAGFINLVLFIYLIYKAHKQKKAGEIHKKITPDLKRFTISAICQVILYLPWVIFLMLQLTQVSEGFWISGLSLETLIEMFEFQFTGNLSGTTYVPHLFAQIFGALLVIYTGYLVYREVKKRKEKKQQESILPGILAILLYLGIIIGIAIISIFMPILYARYLLCITGLLMFFMAFFMSRQTKKWITAIVCGVIALVSIYMNVELTRINYSDSNKAPIEFVRKELQEDDIFIYANTGSGFVMSAIFPEVQQYFWNQAHWNVVEAYKAFGPNMKTVTTLDDLKEYKGRIWLIGANDFALYDDLPKEFKTEILKKETFHCEYKGYQYSIILLEKE